MTDCRTLDAAILRILRRDGPAVFEDIVSRLADSLGLVSTRLYALRREGRVWYTPRRGWHLKEHL